MATTRQAEIKYYDYQGKKYTVGQLAQIAGITRQNMNYRLQVMSVEEAMVKGFKPRTADIYTLPDGSFYSLYQLETITGQSHRKIKTALDGKTPEQVEKYIRENSWGQSEEETEELFEYKKMLLNVQQLADIAKVSVKEMNKRLDTYTTIEECLRGKNESL